MNNDEQLLSQLDKIYRPTLKNTDITNPKMLILFSGPPSSGKSTIARQLEAKFKALRLENDAIRAILVRLLPGATLAERSRVAYKYMDRLRCSLADESHNGLLIIDATIDVYYKDIFRFANDYGYEVFVIAIKIPETVRREWIVKTGDRIHAPVSRYLETMSLRHQQQQDFLSTNKPDLAAGVNYKIEDIYRAVEGKLSSL